MSGTEDEVDRFQNIGPNVGVIYFSRYCDAFFIAISTKTRLLRHREEVDKKDVHFFQMQNSKEQNTVKT